MIPLYHAVVSYVNPPLRPSYASHIIFAIYIFLPLSENLHVIILGSATTICYLIIMTMITYRLETDKFIKVMTELVYFLCLNLFGLYFRLINEAAIRRTFLDRRELVEGNLLLKFARNQEVRKQSNKVEHQKIIQNYAERTAVKHFAGAHC